MRVSERASDVVCGVGERMSYKEIERERVPTINKILNARKKKKNLNVQIDRTSISGMKVP